MTRYTTPDSLPVPESTDTMDPIEGWFGLLADAVQKALTPTVGAIVPKDNTWDLSGTYLTKVGNDVTLVLTASKSAPIAASSSTIVLTVPVGFRPAVQFLQAGVAWNISAPYANPVQVAVNGEVTAFTTSGGQQSKFSALLRWRAV